MWDVELTRQCEEWWNSLTHPEQKSVAFGIDLLTHFGPSLGRPHADTVKNSHFTNMKELRVQHEGRPYRLLYAFDPRRVALVLLGGDKTGDGRWYERAIPEADRLFAEHLLELQRETKQ